MCMANSKCSKVSFVRHSSSQPQRLQTPHSTSSYKTNPYSLTAPSLHSSPFLLFILQRSPHPFYNAGRSRKTTRPLALYEKGRKTQLATHSASNTQHTAKRKKASKPTKQPLAFLLASSSNVSLSRCENRYPSRDDFDDDG